MIISLLSLINILLSINLWILKIQTTLIECTKYLIKNTKPIHERKYGDTKITILLLSHM